MKIKGGNWTKNKYEKGPPLSPRRVTEFNELGEKKK